MRSLALPILFIIFKFMKITHTSYDFNDYAKFMEVMI